MEQLSFNLIGGLCTMPLWFALPRRRTIQRGKLPYRPWQQLTLHLPIRRLIRAASHFIWTRPDGKHSYAAPSVNLSLACTTTTAICCKGYCEW